MLGKHKKCVCCNLPEPRPSPLSPLPSSLPPMILTFFSRLRGKINIWQISKLAFENYKLHVQLIWHNNIILSPSLGGDRGARHVIHCHHWLASTTTAQVTHWDRPCYAIWNRKPFRHVKPAARRLENAGSLSVTSVKKSTIHTPEILFEKKWRRRGVLEVLSCGCHATTECRILSGVTWAVPARQAATWKPQLYGQLQVPLACSVIRVLLQI